jgi:hypothetical protein
MVQTKTGSSNNAWIDYLKVCAKNYKEGKELTTTAKGKATATKPSRKDEKATAAKPPRKDEKDKGAKQKQETEENSKTALRKEHDLKEVRKKKHVDVAKQIRHPGKSASAL